MKKRKQKSNYYNFGEWFKCFKARRDAKAEFEPDSDYNLNDRKPYYSFGLWYKCKATYAVHYRKNRCSARRNIEKEHSSKYYYENKEKILRQQKLKKLREFY